MYSHNSSQSTIHAGETLQNAVSHALASQWRLLSIISILVFALYILRFWIQENGANEIIALEHSHLEPIPGPKPLPILGNALILDINDLVGSILKIAYHYRPIFSLTLLGKREVFVSSPELCRELCDERRFHKLVTKGLERLRPVTGDGLFTASDGNHAWGVAHRLLMPHFGTFQIRDMFDDMIDIAQQLCMKWARMEPWSTLDLQSDFTRLTLDTVALTCLDYRFNSFYRHDSLHPFVQNVDLVLAEAATRATLPDWVISLRYSKQREFERSTKYLFETCQGMIDARRAQGEGNCRKDVLSALVFGRDPKTGDQLSDENIIHNILTFLSAGHETTSATLTLVCYYLCEHPEALAKARAEVDAVLDTQSLTVQHMQKLPYLEAVLRETMRLAPTAPAFFVTAYKDETLGGGKYLVHKGESLCIALEVLQRDERFYGSDATEFRPERMLNEEFEKLDEYAFKPFGNGLRGCIGKTFVWQESLIILAMLIQNFDIRKTDPSYKLKLRSDLSVKPDGFSMQAKRREGLTATDISRRLSGAWQASALDANKSPQWGSINWQNEALTGQLVTILHGSNTGTCEALALQLAAAATAQGFAPHVVDNMNSAPHRIAALAEGPIIMIVASYNGLPADNTVEMIHFLEEQISCGSQSKLKGVNFAVFGCGHRDWKETYQKVPLQVEDLMLKAGASRITQMGVTDAASSDLFSDLESWSGNCLFPALCTSYNVRPDNVNRLSIDGKSNMVAPPDAIAVTTGLPAHVMQRTGFVPAIVTERQQMSSSQLPSDVPSKHHIELRLAKGDKLIYAPGDHVLVLPRNDPALVARVLGRFELAWDTIVTINFARRLGLKGKTEMTASELFAVLQEHTFGQSPVIMICVGSGLAIFRGLIQERTLAVKRGASSNLTSSSVPIWHLFYGCRGQDLDEMYSSDLLEAEALGFMTVNRSYSRHSKEDTKYPRYITESLKSRLSEIVNLWNANAVVYVCAGKAVADSVFAILGPELLHADKENGNIELEDESLGSWRQKLGLKGDSRWRGRYVEEIFN
ncbi:NADPH cytochrome P450 [Diaporthe amygdali]|uniref:NADPH cytochrome P450 n=1 Tax=Phomopsis amygdali TaxID=1214568 RepID=UPI0022FDE4CE|nr:NADPH cytochrome P450 [Diaporthe amygdali]KAJ0123076.1 NADPH cytochrome P450 [Diaporthe amygdali]